MITWREGGIEGKAHLESIKGGGGGGGGLDVTFNTYRGGGHYFFYSFSQIGKVVEELLEFLTLELNWKKCTPGVLISELANYLIIFPICPIVRKERLCFSGTRPYDPLATF